MVNTWRRVKEMDERLLAIRVPGASNRNPRSLRQRHSWKAHELQFFIQHGAPYFTAGIVPKPYYKVICLASRIAHSCTKDTIAYGEIDVIKDLATEFMVAFKKSFGIEEMKYGSHLILHIWRAVELYGPLQNVSCYGPEDMIEEYPTFNFPCDSANQ